MILTDYLTGEKNLQWEYAKQTGISHATIRLPEDNRFDLNNFSHMKGFYEKFTDFGLTPMVIEPMPNCLHSHIKTGDKQRDESIEKVIRMFPILDELNLRIICLNFMAHIGWYRSTNHIKERGGALVTGFDLAEAKVDPSLSIGEEELWANLKYFLEAVIPYAEKYGIKLGLHPDDPPVEKLGNVSRILTSMKNVQRAVDLVPSQNLGVSLCQGTFSAMGEDVIQVIRHFGSQNKIFFVHFRDIKGTRSHFHETFHDNGQTDMAEAIRTYRDCHYSGPVRVDHVPTMAGEENTIPGYASVGRLFAIGYLKGLLDASGCSDK